MTKKHFVIVHPHCHIIKGAERAVILDTFRCTYHFIPLLLAKIFPTIHNSPIVEVLKSLGNDKKSHMKEYLDFLAYNDIINFSNNVVLYDKINTQFEYPAQITNVIIKDHLNDSLIKELETLQCEHIQIFISNPLTHRDTESLLNRFENTCIQHIEVIMEYSTEFVKNMDYVHFFDTYRRLQRIILYNAKSDDSLYQDSLSGNVVITVKRKICYADCGEIHPIRFLCNLPFFTEAQHHNTCLNRKVCIDAEGNIKNCPAMTKNYGNIKDTTLEEAINKLGFKDLWFICKDQIDVCKDCEFRYMCTDCRCFIKDPDNIYSQPAKCTYNPYICLWEGQEGYVPVEECGTYSRETGFVPDKKRIAELNKRIWGEE